MKIKKLKKRIERIWGKINFEAKDFYSLAGPNGQHSLEKTVKHIMSIKTESDFKYPAEIWHNDRVICSLKPAGWEVCIPLKLWEELEEVGAGHYVSIPKVYALTEEFYYSERVEIEMRIMHESILLVRQWWLGMSDHQLVKYETVDLTILEALDLLSYWRKYK